MKSKKINLIPCLLSIAVLLGGGCSKVENRIPRDQFSDQEFDWFCLENFDTDRDGFISSEEAKAVTKIHIQKKSIKSFKGIEIFTELTTLQCDNISGLKEIDLSENKKLTTLSISSLFQVSYDKNTDEPYYSRVNTIETFKLGAKPDLETLKLPNATTSFCDIEIDNCPNLKYLEIGMDCNLKLGELPQLKHLICRNSEYVFTLLDLSKYPDLEYLDLKGSTNLEEIDISGLHNLKTFLGGTTPLYLDKVGVRRLKLISTSASALESIEIEGVRNLSLDLRSNSNLEILTCFYDESLNEKWKSEMTVQFPENGHLKYVDLSNILCKDLNFSTQSHLETVRIVANERPRVIWPQNNVITILDYVGCFLKEIDLRSFSQLQSLNLSQNWLTEVDLAPLSQLTSLACNDNKLQSLDLSQNQELTSFSATNNSELNKLILPQTATFKSLQIDTTNLNELDISRCSEINSISAQNTPLKKLFVSDQFKWSNSYILPDFTQLFRKSTGEEIARD